MHIRADLGRSTAPARSVAAALAFGLIVPLVMAITPGVAAAAEQPGVEAAASGGQIQSQCSVSRREVRNVRSIGHVYPEITRTSAHGPYTLSISVSRTFSNSWSASASISSGAVSAGVGFSVTSSKTVTVTGTRSVPSGKHGTLVARQKRQVKAFDVWHYYYCTQGAPNYWRKAGSGSAQRFVGYYFSYYQQ